MHHARLRPSAVLPFLSLPSPLYLVAGWSQTTLMTADQHRREASQSGTCRPLINVTSRLGRVAPSQNLTRPRQEGLPHWVLPNPTRCGPAKVVPSQDSHAPIRPPQP